MDSTLLELYSDYLIASFGQVTATGLSQLLDGAISHDQVTRFLASSKQSGRDLWRKVKPLVRQIESKEGVLIFDDTIEEKPYTDENDVVCWHYDHSKGRSVKGINLITALYQNGEMSIPVSFEIVDKTEVFVDEKTGKENRRSTVKKNERFRRMLAQCVHNRIVFRYVLSDVWFASAENMRYTKLDLGKDFLFPLKHNRKVALSEEDKSQGRYVRVDELEIKPDTVQQIYLEGVPFALLLTKEVFTNEDGSSGILYLITNDLTLDSETITTCYKRRWKVEEYHKSLKQNASLAKSPTKTETTQTNHLFAALCAFVKLEKLKITTSKNHYAMKAKLYLKALKTAYDELQMIKETLPVALATA